MKIKLNNDEYIFPQNITIKEAFRRICVLLQRGIITMSIISKKSLLGQKKKEKREAENNSKKESNKPEYVHKHKLTFWEKIPVVSGFVRLITNTSIINVI
jgi:hypothetical protein